MENPKLEAEKELLNQSCDEMQEILKGFENSTEEFVRIARVLGPLVDEIVRLKDECLSSLNPSPSVPEETQSGEKCASD